MLESLLITGANGFVGLSLLDYLVALPNSQRPRLVAIVARREFPQIREFIEQGLNIKLFLADLTEPWTFDRDFSHVIQLAADGSSSAYSDEASFAFVKISQQLINWCELSSQPPFVFHASSGACFGYQSLDSGQLINSIWNKEQFVAGRLQVEQMLKNAEDNGKMNLRIGRLYSFLGSRIATKIQYAAPAFAQMAKYDGTIRIKGNPSTVRSYLAASDMADWIMKSFMNINCNNLLTIGSSTQTTILELANEIARLFDAEVEIQPNLTLADRYVADNKETMGILGVQETKTWKESVLEMVEKI